MVTRVMKAFNVGCCDLVGELGIKAEAKCLRFNIVGVISTPAGRIIALSCAVNVFFADINASV